MQTEAQLFKALADETRLKILWLLLEQKELCVTGLRIPSLERYSFRGPVVKVSCVGRVHPVLINLGNDRQFVFYEVSLPPPPSSGKNRF
jgi:DNA-binding transcriptional ArsR family regulator